MYTPVWLSSILHFKSSVHTQWWYIPAILVLGRLRQKDSCDVQDNLSYTVKFCLKNKNICQATMAHAFNISA